MVRILLCGEGRLYLAGSTCGGETECDGRCTVKRQPATVSRTGPRSTPPPNPHPSQTTTIADVPETRLDVKELERAVRRFFTKGLAQSTQRTYKSGKNRYIKFCQGAALSSLPVTEQGLCSFTAHLALHGLKYLTIKVYLSAVRHLQIASTIHS